jgi:hypothetical protein
MVGHAECAFIAAPGANRFRCNRLQAAIRGVVAPRIT